MKIVGIEGKTYEALDAEIAQGAKFVYYTFAISILVMTFRRSSNVFYLPPGQNAVVKGLPYTFLTLVAGWWGIPWGPIYSIGSLVTNLGGGKDVTDSVLGDLEAHAAQRAARDAIAPASLDTVAPAPL